MVEKYFCVFYCFLTKTIDNNTHSKSAINLPTIGRPGHLLYPDVPHHKVTEHGEEVSECVIGVDSGHQNHTVSVHWHTTRAKMRIPHQLQKYIVTKYFGVVININSTINYNKIIALK